MSENVKITNVETIEIVLDGIRKQYSLSQLQDLLKGKKLVDIEAIGDFGQFGGKEGLSLVSPSGNHLVGENGFFNTFLTLNVKGKEKIKNMPLFLLSKQAFTGHLRPQFDNLEPDWAKSYLLFAMDPGKAGNSILLTIYFND